jgi:putative transposase
MWKGLPVSEKQAIVRYNYRLRPGAVAEKRLLLEWNCARYVWNQCVEAGEASYKLFKGGVEHDNPTFCRMSKKLTGWRAEFDWLREGSQVVQQQMIRKWSESHQAAFKQPAKGFPKFKSGKVALPSLEYTSNGFKLKGDKLFLAGGISIPVVWSRELPSEPKSCIVTRDGAGHWSVSFVVRRDNEEFPDSDESIGIDWGVATVATTTDSDFDLPCGNQTKNTAEVLKQAQRKLSRAVKGSLGRKKAKKKVARIHLKIARQRKDRAFKWSRKIVTAFGRLAIEDFKPKFLAKSTMAKKATDGAVGMTKQILITMAEAAGRTVSLVNPAYTTMECSECGTRNKARIALNIRTFECHACGYTAGRDFNAARTIRARAGFNPTNVDDVRLLHDFGCVVAV